MIMNKEDVRLRLESPDNLINQLKVLNQNNSAKLKTPFGLPEPESTGLQVLPPSIDDLVDNIGDRIKAHGLKSKALDVLDKAVSELQLRISEAKPQTLATIAMNMNSIVHGEEKDRGKTPTHLTIWQPIMIQENHFETLQVSE